MSAIPPDHARSEGEFLDFKPALDEAAAIAEANRCLFCYDAPCIKACPTGIDIPGFIRKIGTGNTKGSAKTILASNIMGMSCARVCPVEVLCVGACVYNEFGEQPPIAIGKLQRFATDAALKAGWRFFAAGKDSGKKVALLGGGPASLACAHELRRQGHRVTIYEKRDVLGGLNTWGVAPYKLRANDASAEVDYVMGIGGVEVKLGVEVGTHISLAELESQYDAVFVGIGLGPDTRLKTPGEDLPGILGAVEWIEKMKLGIVELAEVQHAIVVGGGNTAIDVVRELRGLGVPKVGMLYRGGEAGMSGYSHEWEAAKVDGVMGLWQMLPVAYEGDGRVERIKVVRVGADKKPIPGTEHEIPAELVLLAVGQSKIGDLVGDLEGITLDKGRIVVGAGGATGRAKWWAGGDAANGGKEVVNAVAEGRDAAKSIHMALTGATNA